MSFVEDARDKALADGANADESVEAWAARAFSVIAVLGGIEGAVSAEGLDSLSTLLSKAPVEVVLSGTMAVMAARATAGML